MVSYLLRRRALGNTSTREVARASQTGLQVFRNDGRKLDLETGRYARGRRAPVENLPTDADYVFRYGCTSSVPGNPKIVNNVSAIHKVNDKSAFRKLTADAGLAPKTWLFQDEFLDDDNVVGMLEQGWRFKGDKKYVLRSRSHAQGRNLHVLSHPDDVEGICARYGSGNYYISELIDKVAEYRVFVCQGRAVWVAKKTPGNPDQVAWNVAQGGRFDNVGWGEWPLKVVKVAIEAFYLSDLHFGGVDVMVDAEGNAYVLEINSAPSQTSPYRQQATAKAFDYIVRNGRENIPMIEDRGGYRKFIHPCMTSDAIVPEVLAE